MGNSDPSVVAYRLGQAQDGPSSKSLAWPGGRDVAALVLTVPILIAVTYMAVTHIDVPRGRQAIASRPARTRHRAV